MSQFDYKRSYSRNRPHLHPPGATLFITFRLAGSVPKTVLSEYQHEKVWIEKEFERLARRTDRSIVEKEHESRLVDFHRTWFVRFENILDKAKDGPMWLGKESVRRIIAGKFLEADVTNYRLDAFSIMSNHVHCVLKPNLSETSLTEVPGSRGASYVSADPTLSRIMQVIKGSTAREANKLLGRSGPFWEKESYDHAVRDEAEFHRVVKYTLNNPVKAGLASNWRDWPGNCLAAHLQDRF